MKCDGQRMSVLGTCQKHYVIIAQSNHDVSIMLLERQVPTVDLHCPRPSLFKQAVRRQWCLTTLRSSRLYKHALGGSFAGCLQSKHSPAANQPRRPSGDRLTRPQLPGNTGLLLAVQGPCRCCSWQQPQVRQ